jgi:endo-1,4-beta-xylanase
VLAAAALVVAAGTAPATAAAGDSDQPLVIAYGSPNIGGPTPDDGWQDVTPVPVDLTAGNPAASATFQAMWDEQYLYTLTTVTDPVLDASSGQLYNQDSVELFFDTANDKSAAHSTYVPLQDFQFRVSYQNVTSFDHGGDDRLISNARPTDGGFQVESVFRLGDLDGVTLAPGKRLGFDVQINDGAGGNRVGQLFWHDGTGNQWQRPAVFGTIELGPRPAQIPDRVDKIELFYAITEAGRINPDIYDNADVLDTPLARAKDAFADADATQAQVDAAEHALSAALAALRRTGPYPDPKQLPAQESMPDLFTFLDGSKVTTTADWQARRDEIAGMAQYYEYGYEAPAPDTLTARKATKSTFDLSCFCVVEKPGVEIAMTQDVGGTTVSRTFSVTLELPDPDSGYQAPYPVVIGFGDVPGAGAFHAAGIATISYTPTDIGNEDHTGIYYDFDPYHKDVIGSDTGTLMAWAWGVSRVVDAISVKDPATGHRVLADLDPHGIAVTGHSRYGKGTLVAGAFDDRIAVVAPNGSGTGGASSWRYQFAGKDYRQDDGGTSYPWAVDDATSVNSYVETINNTFGGNAAWFTNVFGEFREPSTPAPVRLPFDQDSVMALVAPRALVVTGGYSDWGTNPESMAMSYRAADKAYELLGVPDRIGLAYHEGGHTHTEQDTAHLLSMMQYYLRGDTSATVTSDLVAMKEYPFHTYDASSAPWDVPALPSATVTSTPAEPGGTTTVAVGVGDSGNVADATLRLEYDPSRLAFDAVHAAAGLALSGTTDAHGVLSFTVKAPAGGAPASALASVSFRATDRTGEAPVEATVALTRQAADGYRWQSSATGSGTVEVALEPWQTGQVYDTGDRVGHDGHQYLAGWWTTEEPGSSPWGSWQEIATDDDGTAVWTSSRVFDTGDVVVHDGVHWTAKWWTRNQEPGDPNGPWERRG